MSDLDSGFTFVLNCIQIPLKQTVCSISRDTKMSHLRIGKNANEIRNGFNWNLKIYLLRVSTYV